jgi:serine protease DegS
MNARKLVTFVMQAVTVGIVAATVLLIFKPELFAPYSRVVEFREAMPSLPLSRQEGPVSYAKAVSLAASAVVNIYTSKRVTSQPHPMLDDPLFQRFFGDRFDQPRQRLETSLGSGVIISPEGYVLTNNHVIEGAEEILVGLHDGRSVNAAVVGSDPETDLAILRIELPELPSLVIGRSDELEVGDVVLAIGNPFGVGQTVTMGIVSATGRSQLGINTFEDFIQTDAAINPGNSGGALINARGELVGINTAIYSRTGGSQGIGFAIPMGIAKDVLTQIVEHGRVARGWLGVEIQDLTPELAESFGHPDTAGALIAGVLRNGPAHKAGLEPGDILTEVDDQAITGVREALNSIARIRPGTRIRLNGTRQGEPFTLDAIVGERPAQNGG